MLSYGFCEFIMASEQNTPTSLCDGQTEFEVSLIWLLLFIKCEGIVRKLHDYKKCREETLILFKHRYRDKHNAQTQSPW